jgi:hypothetical protein
MTVRVLLFLLLSLIGSSANALLHPDYEKLTLAQALEKAKADPKRHVMIYFGLESSCPPCIYTRGILSGGG